MSGVSSVELFTWLFKGAVETQTNRSTITILTHSLIHSLTRGTLGSSYMCNVKASGTV